MWWDLSSDQFAAVSRIFWNLNGRNSFQLHKYHYVCPLLDTLWGPVCQGKARILFEEVSSSDETDFAKEVHSIYISLCGFRFPIMTSNYSIYLTLLPVLRLSENTSSEMPPMICLFNTALRKIELMHIIQKIYSLHIKWMSRISGDHGAN